MCVMKTIQLQYFAILREQAGTSHAEHNTEASTLADLYAELRQQHEFTLEASQIKVACNEEFVPLGTPLADGDTVVFIPPVAGG